MKQLKWVFAVIMTAITVMLIFFISDVIVVGLIYLLTSLFDKIFAAQLFKVSLVILLSIEFILTIPATIKTINEGDKK